ncbi:hypothetical protein P153DRAFT_370939 [Dothidotthia symphoricarpi CBS 119687]|uniref:Uncharacterized protein n=1 Tax=Dothidotthia symphoricarpi CBS 119687 TaxID=1392245 RepID=A0A6A5ZYC5_9PLEO|nr:uncharacterized protein P153DRAFT_370939 [Dothidotthia symphoricarpi CBS 119687]KAF2124539.1 hypothetical protein P153DRAFT_370939 [Dothidotthia symphoricarpi CBS 119687]
MFLSAVVEAQSVYLTQPFAFPRSTKFFYLLSVLIFTASFALIKGILGFQTVSLTVSADPDSIDIPYLRRNLPALCMPRTWRSVTCRDDLIQNVEQHQQWVYHVKITSNIEEELYWEAC